MADIRVHVDIAAPVASVWKEAANLATHSDWMADAESIEFLTDQRSGLGARMRVLTVVGPIRINDIMEVVEWVEQRAIGVRHSGLVTGTGRFELSPIAGATRFSWTETLRFPLYLGGPITAFLAKPILRWIWKRNLEGLKERLT